MARLILAGRLSGVRLCVDSGGKKRERYQIYITSKAGSSQKKIGILLDRSPSTISRERQRKSRVTRVSSQQAQRRSDKRRRTAHKAKKMTAEIIKWIKRLIRQELSPQQVVDYIKKHKKISLHYETVYKFIYNDKACGGNLYRHLHVASKPYRKRYGAYDRRGRIKNRVGIEDRPAVVDRRNRVGDWEGDTVMGLGRKSALLTMVERKTLYTVIARLTGKRADLLAEVTIDIMSYLKDKLKTITYDNGLEFVEHEQIAKGLEVDIYFAHPYCSWERGWNENTNGLIRQ